MAELLRGLDAAPASYQGGWVSIGNFDGVHRGHLRIVEELCRAARADGVPAVAFTFDPHPLKLLRPHDAPTPLCWTERKAQLLFEQGVEVVVAYPTDLRLLQLTAREFFEKIVRDKLAARGLVEGPNFRFGRGREGDIDALVGFCREAAMPIEIVERIASRDGPISSTAIRRLLAEGRVAEAAELLSRPHRIRATVVRGEGRGSRIGFPTANLEGIDVVIPGDGVYAGRAYFGDPGRSEERGTMGQSPRRSSLLAASPYAAAINVGPNPTFGQTSRKVEVHLLDFEGELYGSVVEVDFLQRLRDVRRFERVEDLTAQLRADVDRAGKVAGGAG